MNRLWVILTMGSLAVFGSAWAEVKTKDIVAAETDKAALVQGGFWIGHVQPESTVKVNGTRVWVSADGLVVLGFSRDAVEKQVLEVCLGDNCREMVLRVKPRAFVTQKVTHVPPKTVEPSPAEVKQMEADNKATQAARDGSMEARDQEAFSLLEGAQLPINAPTSGVFGSRRTYNGQERSWHKGHDLAATTGTPVHAPANGIVRLARPTFMSGNLIMLDHGAGITTVYAHLSRMNVKVGDDVKAGDVIGKVGTTGRSSGPHLHWGLYWQNDAIDPILWVSPSALAGMKKGK